MAKFGQCVDCEHQLRYAHAMHLAVCDVLYKKRTLQKGSHVPKQMMKNWKRMTVKKHRILDVA